MIAGLSWNTKRRVAEEYESQGQRGNYCVPATRLYFGIYRLLRVDPTAAPVTFLKPIGDRSRRVMCSATKS